MGCPIPAAKILLADGRTKPAGALEVGDELDTLHEKTLKRGAHKVTYVEIIDSKVLELNFSGEILHCSPTHKLYLPKTKEWIEVKDLKKKDKVSLLNGDIEFTSRKPIEDGQVVVIKVDKAHTYICEGILSHNKGNTTINYPKQEKDTRFEDYLKSQQDRELRDERRDWRSESQAYDVSKGQQQAGRAGWDNYKDMIGQQMTSGLLTYNQASQKLGDYSSKYNLAAGTLAGPGTDPGLGWDDVPDDIQTPTEWTTPERWQNWSVAGAQQQLGDIWTGTGEIDETTGVKDRGLRGQRFQAGVNQVYQELLGEAPTAEQLSTAMSNYDMGVNADIDSLRTSITSSKDYKDRFNKSYLENYYETQWGKATKEVDETGAETGRKVHTFKFDDSLLPDYAGDIADRTNITLPDYGEEFTGTPEEIQFQLDNIRQSRKFLYNAGLTNLQGTIDKENTALRTEGAKDVAKIGEQGGLYRGLVGSFNFS
jgi:hypothetical protein